MKNSPTSKWIVSSFNQDCEWLQDYVKTPLIINRGETEIPNSIITENLGTDIADKMRFIIENYDNLPDVCVFIKANLFKYISKEEFDLVCKNTTFTPLLTANHRVYDDQQGPVCYYEDGMYHERNDYWFLLEMPTKTRNSADELKKIFKMDERKYNAFAPGSNYIVPRENILKHPKELYEKLLELVMWSRYNGEAQLIERNLYYLWK